MSPHLWLIGAVIAVATTAAHAEVIDAQANGFTVREISTIAAKPARVWQALGRLGAWWDPIHTYSGDSTRLSIDLTPGGEWRERLADGGVVHMVVVNAQPGRLLRLEGALGPLQAFGVVGHLTVTLRPVSGGTEVIQTYDVGGHAPGGLDKLAAPVDGVLTAQLARLRRYAETGPAR